MPIIDSESVECFSKSSDQTCRLGMRLGALLKAGDLLCLYGDLGAGKTTFIRGLGQGWGSIDPVTSPTFVLINEYGRLDKEMLFHMDAYRIQSGWEAEELDFERMFQKGVVVIEWAERIDEILPKDRLEIHLSWINEEQRKILLTPTGKKYQEIVSSFRQKAFGV